MTSKSINIRDLYMGINECKSGYQPKRNLVNGDNDDLLADPHNILNRLMIYFSQLLNIHRISDVRQSYICEPLVPDPNIFKAEIMTAKLRRLNCQAEIKFLHN